MKAAENAVILWQGWLDLNQRMRESKSLALPLGYTPIREKKGDRDSIPDPALFVGWVKGLEPATYCLEGSCSILLSYWRKWMEQVTGIEPASPAWKAGALAIVLHLQEPSATCQLLHDSTEEA